MADKKQEITSLKDANAGVSKSDNLDSYINSKFIRAKSARKNDEDRWLQAYRNYRGVYGPDVTFTDTEKSQIFIKVTKTKVLAAYGQIVDVLFSHNRFPIGVEPTTIPEGVVESVNVDPKKTEAIDVMEKQFPDLYGFAGDGKDLQPGDTPDSLLGRLGPLTEDLQDINNLEEGPGVSASAITFHPAAQAAIAMEKKIRDQLEESAAGMHLRHACFECVLFGTGILKGPFAKNKEYPVWSTDGEYTPVIKTSPNVEFVSIWDYYPDPDAHSTEDSTHITQRHRMTRGQLRDLKKRPFFLAKGIDEAVSLGENYTKEWWEDQIRDDGQSTDSGSVQRYEVLEYWGAIDVDLAKENDIDLPGSFNKDEELQINAWVCNGQVLRLVVNPFTPKRLPYLAVPYELNPYSQFGVGLSENMEDTQTLMNGFMRMAVDNAVLSGSLLIEVDETALAPGQDLTIYPGKIFRRQSGAPGQAIFGTKFPNVSSENMLLFDKARVLADESSGLPSYSYGQTGVQGLGRAASGISMLMGAASNSIRTVIKNFDDYLLRPLGEAFFAFNMQFDFDPDIHGDLEVRARGTESFMKNEVRSQRLISFLQIASNPTLAPFAKFPYIMREIANTMDLDVDKVTNNPEEAFRQAILMQQIQKAAIEANPPEVAVGQDVMGTGGGTIGTGQAPVPGEQGAPGGNQPQQGAANDIPPEIMAALQQGNM